MAKRFPGLGFSPDLLRGLTTPLADMAAGVERRIVAYVTSEALKPAPQRAGFTRRLRRLVVREVAKLVKKSKSAEDYAVQVGTRTAGDVIKFVGLDKVVASAPKMPRNPQLGNTTRIPKALHVAVRDVAPVVVESGSALYREIVGVVAAAPPESDAARRRLAQTTISRFQRRGLTGFVDKGGKRWNLVSYVEMATRTATTALAREAHAAELIKVGLDVVRVTVMPNCHPWCLPFQGRLLSLTGKTVGEYDGEEVVATLAEAMARGYNHPNCRHSIRVHVPGMDIPDPGLIEPGDYRASQELRRLEREVRKAKRDLAGAVSEEGKAKAGSAVRRRQRDVRTYVAASGLPRNRLREQVDVAF